MPNPIWVTSENVKFNGTLDQAVVLETTNNIRSLILWDDLSVGDKAILTDFVNNNGGALPLIGPTHGHQTVDFGGNVIATDPTGLDNTTAAISGKITVKLGGPHASTDLSGLSSSTGAHGHQVVNFSSPFTGATSTGLFPVAGHQSVNFSVLAAGTDATGLPNDATALTATITVNGIVKPISIVGSLIQTFNDLITQLNIGLGASAVATLDIPGKNITFTSATTGSTSAVSIATGTLFAVPLTGFVSVQTSVAGSGLATNAALTSTITVDGIAKSISVLPSMIPTYADVIISINTALGAAGVATLFGSDIIVSSTTYGTSSSVSIVPGTLLPALPGFTRLLSPIVGSSTGARKYGAIVIVDGAIKSVRFTGVEGDTFDHVIAELNTDLGSAATATFVGGNIVITSTSTGTNSSVKIQDTGSLFSSLTGYVGFADVHGTSPINYIATVNVDGTTIPVSVQGSAAQTFASLVIEINADLGVLATAAISNGNIAITSASTGLISKVSITDASLFKSVGAHVLSTPTNGITDMLIAAHNTKLSNGSSLFNHFHVLYAGTKPAVPLYVQHSLKFTYFDGTVWKYLDNDATV